MPTLQYLIGLSRSIIASLDVSRKELDLIIYSLLLLVATCKREEVSYMVLKAIYVDVQCIRI